MHHLINLAKIAPEIFLDIRYACKNNFLGFPVYTKPVCYLHKKAAQALIKVQKELSLLGLGLKVFDGYRPLSVQQLMWDKIQDERYVSNPAKNKGRHTRGTAVDATLVDTKGCELEMPTVFDDFTEKAHSDYPNVSEEALKNRSLLHKVMRKHGFQPLQSEWWHFDFKGWHDDEKFPPLDVNFEQLEKQQ
jgi:D-alanyl-D-alanine dipeptidase